MARLEGTTAALDDAAHALCEGPDEARLEAARVAWGDAYLAWCAAAPYLFGPADDIAMKRRLGTWPVNEIVLDRVVASDEFAQMRINDDLRGFAAAEYLLFVPEGARAATADRRCVHLADVTGQIAELSADVHRRWTDHYGPAMAAPGTDELTIASADHAMALVFAEGMNLTERMLWQRIGVPSGFFRGDAEPDKLEAVHAGLSRDALAATLESMQMLIAGRDDKPGLAASVAEVDAARAEALVERGERVIRALAPNGDEANEPLADTLRREPARLQSLYKQVEALQDQLSSNAELMELPILTVQDGD